MVNGNYEQGNTNRSRKTEPLKKRQLVQHQSHTLLIRSNAIKLAHFELVSGGTVDLKSWDCSLLTERRSI